MRTERYRWATGWPGTARWRSGRASLAFVPRRWPKHGLPGHFSCRAGPMSPAFLAGHASPRPTKRRKGEAGRAGASNSSASRTGGVKKVEVANACGVATRGVEEEVVGRPTGRRLWCGRAGHGGGGCRSSRRAVEEEAGCRRARAVTGRAEGATSKSRVRVRTEE